MAWKLHRGHAVLEVTGAGRRAPYCTFAVRLCSVDQQNVSRSSADVGAVVTLGGRENQKQEGRNECQVSEVATENQKWWPDVEAGVTQKKKVKPGCD